MSRSLLLDRNTWDLTIANGTFATTTGHYATLQDVACALRLFRGELWFNTSRGMPYFENILGKQPSIAFLKSKIEAMARTVPNVAAAKCTINSLAGRNLTGNVAITFSDGLTEVLKLT